MSAKKPHKSTRAPKTPPTKARGWLAYFGFMCLLFCMLVLGGFIAFARYVDRLETPAIAQTQKADGIVVWTGKGGGRLKSSGALLLADKGERLLVSGVNEKIDAAQVAALLSLPEDKAACCVDLDYAAKNTIGNARETAIWAKALDYDHIILVTSAYHMPRAEVEISRAAGRIRITPFPVMGDSPQRWYKNGPRAKRLAQEYAKLLLSYARGRNSQTENTPVLPPLSEQTSP